MVEYIISGDSKLNLYTPKLVYAPPPKKNQQPVPVPVSPFGAPRRTPWHQALSEEDVGAMTWTAWTTWRVLLSNTTLS